MRKQAIELVGREDYIRGKEDPSNRLRVTAELIEAYDYLYSDSPFTLVEITSEFTTWHVDPSHEFEVELA